MLVQSHGQVDEDDIDVDVGGIEECNRDDGDAMDDDKNNQVDCPKKIPMHFEILIKVYNFAKQTQRSISSFPKTGKRKYF